MGAVSSFPPKGQACLGFGQAYLGFDQAYLGFGQAYLSFGQAYLSFGQAYLSFGQAYLSFGLSASRSQSPRRFTASASRASVNPGNDTIHQEPENRYLLPTWIMVPSEGSVGGR